MRPTSVFLVALAAMLGMHATSPPVAGVDYVSAKKPIHITFAAAEGARIRKTFTRELELSRRWSDSSIEIGTWHDAQQIVIIDEYGSLDGQVPDAITRTFERIEMEHSHEWEIPLFDSYLFSGTSERKGTGELVGSRVTFKRVSSEPEAPFGIHEANYVAELMDDSEPPNEVAAHIAGLRASTDATGLLPWREVEIGDHWFTDVDVFHELCWPSGALAFTDSDDEPLVTPVDERLGQNLDGTFRVELVAIERVHGVRYARTTFRGILESNATFHYEWSTSEEWWFGQDITFSYEGSLTIDLYASLQGELWWNLDDGHLDSIHIEGDVTIDQDFGGTEWDQWLQGAGALTGELCADARFERM